MRKEWKKDMNQHNEVCVCVYAALKCVSVYGGSDINWNGY